MRACTYNYTISQFMKFGGNPEYFEKGAIVNVTKTKKVTTYIVETKKVFAKTSKDWAD